jgi:FixJ family two-component response regulator
MTTTAQLIAIIEENPGMRLALEQVLQVSGYDTYCFPSAEELLATPDALEANCFLVEIDLSGMSGVELRKQLFAMGKQTPVIFMTNDFVPASFERHFKARFLHKPFRGHRLINAIRTLLNEESQKSQIEHSGESELKDVGNVHQVSHY